MEESEKIIELKFDRKDFESIYFKDRQDNIFLSPDIRGKLTNLLASLILFVVCTIYSVITDKAAWLIVIALIPLTITTIVYTINARRLLNWRKNVKAFIDKTSRFKTNQLILTDQALSVAQDNIETITKWSSFSEVIIEEDYLSLSGTQYYFFPKNSMSREDYDYFARQVKAHIKNGL